MISTDQALALSAGIGVGLLIGIERGWNLRGIAEGKRVAGVRTFTLLGMLGCVAGLLGTAGQSLAAAAVTIAAAAVVTLGYFFRVKQDSAPDATSAVAALLTLALGALAGTESPPLALAGAAVVTFVLALRTEAHQFIDRLDARDVKALARFAVIAVAVLPFLPSGDFGPYDAWNPQNLWMVVVLVTGFSFAGYVANRVFGARHGTIATALIGGAYSSTAVTQSLAQRLGSGGGGGAEPAGIALATAVMYLRVLILVALFATSVFSHFAVLTSPALGVACLAGLLLYRRAPKQDAPAPPGNPIALVPALAFVIFLAAAAVAVRWGQNHFGEQGLVLLILMMGSLDVDAAIVTVGGLDASAISPQLAAIALGGTIVANMSVKIGITLVYARKCGIKAAFALTASTITLILTLLLALLDLK